MGERNVESEYAKRTSLASLLVPLLRRLADVNAIDLPAGPIEARFRILLNVPASDSVYSALHTLYQSFSKLENQARALSESHPSLSRHGLEAISQLRRVADADLLFQNAHQINQYITNDRLNCMEMLGDILLDQFPIYILPTEKIPEILSLIDEIQKSIRAAGFSRHSEVALLAYSVQLRSAVANWHLLGGDAIGNASGGMLGLVRFIEQNEPDATPDEGKDKSKVLDQVRDLIDWAVRFVFLYESGLGAIRLIEGPVRKLITYVPTIGAQ